MKLRLSTLAAPLIFGVGASCLPDKTIENEVQRWTEESKAECETLKPEEKVIECRDQVDRTLVLRDILKMGAY
jgi:hypothetical protein